MRKKHDVASKAVFVLLTLFASSCTNETMPGGDAPLPTGKYPLEFTSQMYGMDVTRATSANSWDGGEQIALKIGSEVKQYTAATTGAITSITPFYWTNTGETKTVSAYYPYALATATTITIKQDQNDAANYQASDALYAPATPFAFTDATKSLTFRHLPAKVVTNLKAGDGVTTTEVQGATVKFVSQSLTAPFNNTTRVVTVASTGSATVTPNTITTVSNYQKSVQALLVPCQLQNKQFIAVTLGSDTFYYTPTGTDGNLESGKGYTYAITVKRDGIEVKLTESGAWTGGSENVQSLPLMAFTIDLTNYSTDMTYTLPFKTSPTVKTTCEMTVDWGDGEITPFLSGTSLAINSTAFTHTYTEAKEYTITIITAQTDFSQEQIPGFNPGSYRPTNNNVKKLKSLLTPLLNTWESRFNRCFYYCSNLSGSIPKDLFVNNKQVTDFGGCFTECSELSGEIPAGLFATNPLVTNFQQCFDGCTKLTMNANIFCNETNGEGATRFLNKSVSFLYCFRNVGSHTDVKDNAGTAPALWDYSYGTGTPTKTKCFLGIGTVTNKAALDASDAAWKQ